MKQEATNKESIRTYNHKPTPRTIMTRSNSKKWLGCIYLSTFDLTGQVLMFLNSKSGDLPEELSKVPIWFFLSTDKTDIEAKISETISSILKSKML